MTDTSTAPAPTVDGPSRYSRLILAGLQRASHVYAGTVPAHVTARRRAKNRVARASRRTNRAR